MARKPERHQPGHGVIFLPPNVLGVVGEAIRAQPLLG